MVKALLLLSAVLITQIASAQFYDFEGLPNGFNPKNAIPGLTITTGSSPDSLVVGQTFTWAQTRNDFRISDAPALAWSGRNTLYTENLDDFLIDTGGLMASASILTDPSTPESPDVVRIVGLNNVGGDQYKVVAFTQGLDNATTLSGCTLAMSYAPGFRYVMLQVTTEAEAFDNLTLNPVPEPTSLAVLSLGALGFVKRSRLRRQRGRLCRVLTSP